MSKKLYAYTGEHALGVPTLNIISQDRKLLINSLYSDESQDAVRQHLHRFVSHFTDESLMTAYVKEYKRKFHHSHIFELNPHNSLERFNSLYIADDEDATSDDWEEVGNDLWAAYALQELEP